MIEIQKQSTLEAAEEPHGELTERTTMVLKLAEGLGVIDVGIKMFEDTDTNEQRAATTRHGIMRMLTCCEGIL